MDIITRCKMLNDTEGHLVIEATGAFQDLELLKRCIFALLEPEEKAVAAEAATRQRSESVGGLDEI